VQHSWLNSDRKPTADSGTLLLAKVKKYHYELSAVDRRETIPDFVTYFAGVFSYSLAYKCNL